MLGRSRRRVFLLLGLLSFVPLTLWGIGGRAGVPPLIDDPAEQARAILDASGVKGGLVVHVGCGDGRLTACLLRSNSFLVHGLDRDQADVDRARRHIRSLGLYGRVSVDRWDGRHLPYVDNLVNLLVVEEPVAREEILRVLAPRGVAFIRDKRGWKRLSKPWPEGMDEWTHYLHDPSNNAVSQDVFVGPPRHLQWVGSPRWSRHHDHMASMSALVSAGGRIFYIMDEGSRASILLPSKWYLVARDAFSGVILWKRRIPEWWPHLWRLKSGPALLPRRLVAVGDRVYVTLGLSAPISVLDAATGKTLKVLEATKGAEEFILSEGVLFVSVNGALLPPRGYATIRQLMEARISPQWGPGERTLMAVRADTGEVLWSKKVRLTPLTLAADERHVYFYDGERVICLDRKSGKQVWVSEERMPYKKRAIRSEFGPTLVVYDGVVFFTGAEGMTSDDTLFAFSAEDGRKLWSAPHPPTGHHSPTDILVVGGLVWTLETAWGRQIGFVRGYDPRTGDLKVEFPPDVKTYWFHHRCYRARATPKYLLVSRTGIEFVDFRERHWIIHHWVRGGCLYGFMPANGLIYVPPHNCACYIEAKLFGFNALASASPTREVPRNVPDAGRLEKGPAYGEPLGRPEGEEDWPTYRHDPERSGHIKVPVPAKGLKVVWEERLGGELTAPVIARGMVLVADKGSHTLYALDERTGKVRWSYTAGGRIDSPPTVCRGRVVFGCADGYVYCLRASDGELIWRFRAAPLDRRLVAFEQVESVWPVHGSVLVINDVVYCVAGRSRFLDGGLRLLRLDLETGRKISETVLDEKDPKTGKNLQEVYMRGLNLVVALPDVLSSDGKYVYMRSASFTLDGKPHRIEYVEVTNQRGDDVHLFCPTGFLDGTWFHRSYWIYGRSMASGAGGYFLAGRMAPAGRILVLDENWVYGYGRKKQYYRWTTPLEYNLFCESREIPEYRREEERRRGSWVYIEKRPSQNPAGKPLTVEAWVKALRPNGVVLARGGPAHGYALYIKNGRPRFAIRVKGKLNEVKAPVDIVGRWAHLAGVLTEDKRLLLYVDGKLVAQGRAEGFIASDPVQEMQIGADLDCNVGDYPCPFGLTGIVDEVRVYHRALSPEEIRGHFEAPERAPKREPGLVICFSFEGGRAVDESGNGNDGIVGERVKVVRGRVGQALRFRGERRRLSPPYIREPKWSKEVPVTVRAMVLAGGTLFILGPPDLLDEEYAVNHLNEPEVQSALMEQDAAWEGKRGALLWAVSPEDGEKIAEYRLDSPPVWDGMASAGGRLFISTLDGRVICMGGGDEG